MADIDWKPIETAPKDGAPFMVWGYYAKLLGAASPNQEDAEWGVGVMRWTEYTTAKFEEAGNGLYRRSEETYGSLINAAGGFGSGLHATHWAPLPEGPRIMPKRKSLTGVLA